LRAVHAFRGAREGAFVDDGQEMFEVEEIHGYFTVAFLM
jgi:hypothetical protein